MIVNSWYNGYSPKERDDKYDVTINQLIVTPCLMDSVDTNDNQK